MALITCFHKGLPSYHIETIYSIINMLFMERALFDLQLLRNNESIVFSDVDQDPCYHQSPWCPLFYSILVLSLLLKFELPELYKLRLVVDSLYPLHTFNIKSYAI